MRWLSLLLVAASTVSAGNTQEMRIPLGFVRHLDGAPVRILSYHSGQGSAYTGAVIRNESAKEIAAVVFAAAIVPRSEALPSEWVRTHEIAVPLKPNAEESVKLGMIPDPRIDEAHKKYGAGMWMELGVVDVLFHDGSRWSFDTKGRRSITGDTIRVR